MRFSLCAAVIALFTAPLFSQDIILDNDDGPPVYTETGSWALSGTPGFEGGTYRFASHSTSGTQATATWTTTITDGGIYEIFPIWLRSSNRFNQTRYDVTVNGGEPSTRRISQAGSLQLVEASVGKVAVPPNATLSVTLHGPDVSGTHVVIADAIRIRPSSDDPPTILSVSAADGRLLVAATDDFGITSVTGQVRRVGAETFSNFSLFFDGISYVGDLPAFDDGDLLEARAIAADNAGQTTTSPLTTFVYTAGASPEYRALWIDSWNAGSILNQGDVDALVAHARAHNINTLMVQVRKVGDAAFNGIEPRATNIAAGFDPLARLIQQANDTSDGKKKVHIHAWFVMNRISTSVSLNPNHILARHPEFASQTRDGVIFSGSNGTTRYLDPGHPGAVEHNLAVILDCLERYAVDGVNLDYIRYPEYAGDWGYNPVSVARYNRSRGLAPDHFPNNEATFRQWRRDQVTNMVRKLYIKIRDRHPNVILTACTVQWGTNYTFNPATNTGNWLTSSPYNQVYQDWVGWLREGIIDYNALMNYVPGTSMTRYNGWTNLSLNNDQRRGSIIGIGAYMHTTIDHSIEQLLYARNRGAAGINIYDWDSEVNANTQGATKADFYARFRNEVAPTWANPPISPWIVAPTKGIIQGTITRNGVPEDWAATRVTTQLDGRIVHSDGVGWFGHVELNPSATHTITVTTVDGLTATRTFSIEPGEVRRLDIELIPPASISDWSEL